ncbi:MAG: glycosyltransferase [Lutibacter sp.]|nr:glycosyltransferase [Lutibacter sp.]
MIKRVRKFDQKADLIILRDPLIFQIPFLIRYLKETKIPYLVDIIDLWPELFVSKLPTFLKRFQGLIFFSLYKRRERFLDGAQLITTVTTDYMRILSVKAMRTPRIVTYWGVDCANANLLLKAEKSTLKLAKAEGEFWITYTGTLGVNYDIGIILDTAKMFKNIDYIKFIIAGKGPLESQVRSFILSNELTNLVYIGFISQHELFPLLSKSDLGLLTYSKNSTVAMPIKAYDYLATGLPILNCLKGEIGDLITTYELGFNYSAEDVNSFIDSINVAFEMRITLEKSRERIKSFSHKFDARIQYATLAKFIGDNI